MLKAIASTVAAFALSGVTIAPALAQSMSTPADRVLRPGDKIGWSAASPHFLGAPGLTPRAQVESVFTFSPALTLQPGDILEGDSVVVVTGTVKDDAAKAGGAGVCIRLRTTSGHDDEQSLYVRGKDCRPNGPDAQD